MNIRELMHGFSGYMKEVKSGKKVLIMERNVPIAELIPHNVNVQKPGWKRPIVRIKSRGESFARTLIKERRASR